MKFALSGNIALLSILLFLASAYAAEDDGFIQDQNRCLALNSFPKPNETLTWTGGCKNGFADGEGIQQWFSNNAPTGRYEGRMERGVYQGPGKYTQSNGRTFEGEYRQGKRHGKGVLTEPQGDRYEGTWEDGQLIGSATVTYRNGVRYEGEIKNLRPQGKGLMIYNDRGRYDAFRTRVLGYAPNGWDIATWNAAEWYAAR